eukprot:TRINITY_DN30281_c0_g1_i1.p1 TRINITY_DN30281_c0_g1~~TRINITY_DN30281_c0_g1_i1.p1  ORF type:complete len:608 (+),score=154.40 TRINITY_DN30281_c0_g1_i1:150-1973(+)
MNSEEEFHTARSQEIADLGPSPGMEQPEENTAGISSSLDARAEVPTEKSVAESSSLASQKADEMVEGVAADADDTILKLVGEDLEGKEFDDADDTLPTEEAEVPRERSEEVRAEEVQQEQPILTPLEIAGEAEHAERIDNTLELMLDLEQMEWKGPVEFADGGAQAVKPAAVGEHIADAEQFPMAAAAAGMAAGIPNVDAASAEKVALASDATGSFAETEVGEPDVSMASAALAAGTCAVQDVKVFPAEGTAGVTGVGDASAGRPADSSKSAASPSGAVLSPGAARLCERADSSKARSAKRPRLEQGPPPPTSTATTAQDDGKDPGEEVFREAVAWLLRQLLQQFNAPKVQQVPALLRKYEHHETELLEVALEKYIGGGTEHGGNVLAESERTKVLEKLFAGLGRELLAKPLELRPPSSGEGSLPSFLSQLYELVSHARTKRIQDHASRRKLQPEKPVPAREKTVPPGTGTDSRIGLSFSLRLSLQMAKQKAAGSHAAQSPPAPSPAASASAAASERGIAELEAQLRHEPRVLQLPQELRKVEREDWRKLRDVWAQKFKQLWSASPQGQIALAVLPEAEEPKEHWQAEEPKPFMAFDDVASFLERFE